MIIVTTKMSHNQKKLFLKTDLNSDYFILG